MAMAAFLPPIPLPAFSTNIAIIGKAPRRHSAPRRKPRHLHHPTCSNGVPSASPIPFPVGTTVSSTYKLTSLLGQGASGTTYKATVTNGRNRGEQVAVKALPLSSMQSWLSLDLFMREVRALKSLSHPAVPTYIDSFEVENCGDTVFVLVQRIARGDSLQALIDDGRRFSTAQVLSTFQQLLQVLDYLSSLNPPVLHRDVKPANIILEINADEPVLSLVDFGSVNASTVPTSGGLPSATLVGTFGYMAPEQLAGTADVRTDLYAAGATILTMLTGLTPSAIGQKRLKVDVESVIPARERVKLGNIYTVMCKILEPAPEDRFDTAGAALDALNGKVDVDRPNDAPVLNMISNSLSTEDLASLESAFSAMTTLEGEVATGPFEKLTNWAGKKLRRRKPAGSRVVLERDRTNRLLRVAVPAKGLSGETISKGVFTVAWTGFTAFWTMGVLTGGAPFAFALFSIPFWAAGARLARATAEDVSGLTTLVVSFGGGEREIFYFALCSRTALGRDGIVEGDARDLDGAVVETEMFVNGRPVTELYLCEGTRRHAVGGALEAVEQEWLRDEINDFLRAKRR